MKHTTVFEGVDTSFYNLYTIKCGYINSLIPVIVKINGRKNEAMPNHLLMNRLERYAPSFPPQFSTNISGPETTFDQSKL